MNSLRPAQWAGLALGLALGLYLLSTHLDYFASVTFLGGILGLEMLIACIWKYEQRFLVFLIIAFAWAGMHIPMQGTWRIGRWVVLAAGAIVGYVIWFKTSRASFRLMHLLAFFCVSAAFVSATVSTFVKMASLKALSLLLLFVYCASGARLAVLGREERFFRGLLWAAEVAVYATAICYLGLGQAIWGNPNSLGAVMGVAMFPILLWGWITADVPTIRFRKLFALLLCIYLIKYSMARAGMAAVFMVTLIFCLGLRQYKLLAKATGLALVLVALTGLLAPAHLGRSLADLKDAVLYKGHKEEGALASRRSPWDKTIANIKQHPWFGTGYGTSPTGEDTGLDFGTFSSSAETAREHGSSYMTIAEWVGLMGLMPFVALLALTVMNVGRVCIWMNRTCNPQHYSIPLAMIIIAGLVHACFEDWLFAVGYYLCVYFWVLAFVLADLVPTSGAFSAPSVFAQASSSGAALGAVTPSR